jgi:predicted nucleic-acid-binding protein
VIAVDTNVLVRVVTADDPRQTRKALDLLRREASVFVSKTVLLELEWVLRAAYRLGRERILEIFRGLAELSNVDLEDEASVSRAIDLFANGLDFADGLHLASAGTRRFVSFDAPLRRRARRLGVPNVSAL